MTLRPLACLGALGAVLAATTTTPVDLAARQAAATSQPATTAPRSPARSLTRPVTPSATPDAAGFIRRWLVLEPVRVPPQLTEPAVREAVAKAALPEGAGPLPRDGDVVTIDGATAAWHAVDTRGYNVNLFHFAYALDKPTSNVLFWAVTVIDAPREMPGVRLAIGSNAASLWWLNGEPVIGLFNDRQAVVDDGVSKRVTLRKGANVVRAAIVNAGGATDFCARVIDERGAPVRSLAIRLDAGPTRK
jgi:hypothetical protein